MSAERLDDSDDHVRVDAGRAALPVDAADSLQPVRDENLKVGRL